MPIPADVRLSHSAIHRRALFLMPSLVYSGALFQPPPDDDLFARKLRDANRSGGIRFSVSPEPSPPRLGFIQQPKPIHKPGRVSLLEHSSRDRGPVPPRPSTVVDRLRASRQVAVASTRPRPAQPQPPQPQRDTCSLTLPVEFAFAVPSRKDRPARPGRPPKVQRPPTLSSSFAPRVVVPKPGSLRHSDQLAPIRPAPRPPPRCKSPVMAAPTVAATATATRSPTDDVSVPVPLTESALASSFSAERMPLGERLRRFLEGLDSSDQAVVDEDEARMLISSSSAATDLIPSTTTRHARPPTPPRPPLAFPSSQPLARPKQAPPARTTQLHLPLKRVASNALVRGGRHVSGQSKEGREAEGGQVEDGSRPSKKARWLLGERERQRQPLPPTSKAESGSQRRGETMAGGRQVTADRPGRTREGMLRG
jgi:hypothetical protein